MRIKNEINYKVLEQLFMFTRQTWSKWKKEKRPIVKLIEKTFSEKELIQFINTGEIPSKIEWANHEFSELYTNFVRYLILNDGSKALMTAVCNNDNLNNIDNLVMKEYDKGSINQYDLINFFNNKPSFGLLKYIEENKRNNWSYFKEEANNNDISYWSSVYLDILLLAIKKDIHDVVFTNYNRGTEYGIVPPAPLLFTCYDNYEEIDKKYYNLLIEIRNSIENDAYKDLDLYFYYNNFDLNTKPELK